MQRPVFRTLHRFMTCMFFRIDGMADMAMDLRRKIGSGKTSIQFHILSMMWMVKEVLLLEKSLSQLNMKTRGFI